MLDILLLLFYDLFLALIVVKDCLELYFQLIDNLLLVFDLLFPFVKLVHFDAHALL